jgi:hypothetical protein
MGSCRAEDLANFPTLVSPEPVPGRERMVYKVRTACHLQVSYSSRLYCSGASSAKAAVERDLPPVAALQRTNSTKRNARGSLQAGKLVFRADFDSANLASAKEGTLPLVRPVEGRTLAAIRPIQQRACWKHLGTWKGLFFRLCTGIRSNDPP